MFSFGHSLGGAMLLSAARAKIVGKVGKEPFIRAENSYSAQKQQGSSIKPYRSGFGDLVVLLNPAIEARAWEEFDRDIRSPGAYEKRQLPNIIAIASAEDSAVGTFFPISRWLRVIPMPWKLFTESKMDRRGIGHYGKHITHFLKCSEPHRFKKEEKDCDCPYPAYEQPLVTFTDWIRDFNGKDNVRLSTENQQLSCNLQVNPKLDFIWSDNFPYMVIQTDESVIDDHNDIYNPALVTFLASFIEDMLLDKDTRRERIEQSSVQGEVK